MFTHDLNTSQPIKLFVYLTHTFFGFAGQNQKSVTNMYKGLWLPGFCTNVVEKILLLLLLFLVFSLCSFPTGKYILTTNKCLDFYENISSLRMLINVYI